MTRFIKTDKFVYGAFFVALTVIMALLRRNEAAVFFAIIGTFIEVLLLCAPPDDTYCTRSCSIEKHNTQDVMESLNDAIDDHRKGNQSSCPTNGCTSAPRYFRHQ